jgi:hypothetical protein
MSDFEQTSFLGASVRSFNASIGWGTQASQLSVELVEDFNNGDLFTPPLVGSPVSFNCNGWNFNGLLQSYKTAGESGGYPLYSVTVVDPREILEGVQLILDGYFSSVNGVPNLLNVYGYLENISFGNSEINESGIPWKKVRDTVTTLTSFLTVDDYGGPIHFANSTYTINLQGLPDLPEYYRVGGSSMSLMDFINEICEATGCDFFITMVEVTTGIFSIVVNIVNRQAVALTGSVNEFIQNLDGLTSKESGYELVNNPTGKFVVGGNIEEMYYRVVNKTSGDPTRLIVSGQIILNKDKRYYTADDNVWPFWGFDSNGNAIIGSGTFEKNYHRFTLDSRGVEVDGVGATYPTDTGEMRAALVSMDSWMSYLELRNDDRNAPQYQRYTRINGSSPFSDFMSDIMSGVLSYNDLLKMDTRRLGAFTKRQARIMHNGTDDPLLESLTRLYDNVRSVASEYYGKKFMVKVPFIYTKVEPETLNVITSRNPIDSAFLDESSWASAVQNNLLPLDVDRLTTSDYKIQAYVRFDNFSQLDLSELSPDDYILSNDLARVFVKCSVEPNIVYQNLSTAFSPRAIITLPGAVRLLHDYLESNIYNGALNQWLSKFVTSRPRDFNPNDRDVRTVVQEIQEAWSSLSMIDSSFIGHAGAALVPDLVAVPLRNNISSYGPWYAYGANGKIEFERDESLVPWNYGGFTIMNLAGNAKVNEALTNQQISETGTIEIAGIPTVSLGSALISGGPFVTDVRVSIGEQGATTTYNMQLSPRFGKFEKSNIERLARLSKTSQKIRKEIRNIRKKPGTNSKVFKQREYGSSANTRLPSTGRHSSNIIIAGQCVPTSNGRSYIDISIQPDYNSIAHVNKNYIHKSVVSLDALFCPYGGLRGSSNLPMTISNIIGYSPNLNTLSDVGQNIAIATNGTEIPESGMYVLERGSDAHEFRGIALRGPLWIAGWGRSTLGYAAPTGVNPWISESDIANKPTQWKAGPLDARWDEAKGIWTTQQGFWAKITDADRVNGKYSWLTSPVNADTNRMSVYDGQFNHVITGSGNYSDPSGYAVEALYTSPYIPKGSIVWMQPCDNLGMYKFFYQSTGLMLKTSYGTISALTESGLGSGSGEIVNFSNFRSYSLTGEPLTLFSMSSSEVSSGVYVQAKYIQGRWFVDVEDCG